MPHLAAILALAGAPVADLPGVCVADQPCAARRLLVFVDYHASPNDGRGGFLPGLSAYSVHANAAGDDRMKVAVRTVFDLSRSDGPSSP